MRQCILAAATCGLLFIAPPVAAQSTATCVAVDEDDIAALFDKWNDAIRHAHPKQIAALYTDDAVLLPTVSNQVRYTPAERADYFAQFQAKRPAGHVDERHVWLGCNSAVDSGVYTFRFGTTGESVRARYSFAYAHDGRQWRITSHHSSAMPEGQGTQR